MSLSSKAMIVSLHVSCWTARKQDKKVSSEVEQAHNARDAGRFNKLLIDKAALDPLTSFAGRIRDKHYDLTLPWLDNGGRLLPSKLFFEYRKTLEHMKSEYATLVDNFLAGYDTQVQAARNRLGTMFNPEDYPQVAALRRKFAVELDIVPVPQAADFRVDVGDAERARIQREMEERMAKRQAEASAATWERIREVVSTIYLRTSADKPVIRDSLIENARDLVALLPGLNLDDDPAMTTVARAISDNLLVDLWTLRNNRFVRQKVAQSAQLILQQIPAAPTPD